MYIEDRITTIWDFMTSNKVATQEELELVTSIWGYNEDTLMKVIFSRTGYRNFEQLNDDGKYIVPESLI